MKMLNLSDDWIDSCGHWFDEYVSKTNYSIPELVRNFSANRSLEGLSSAEIITVMEWFSSHKVSHIPTGSNGLPHVRPYEDESTGLQPAGYYDFEDDFFAYAQNNGWLSIPTGSWYGNDAVVGIADNFEEVDSHVTKLLESWRVSEYKFISDQKYIVSIRQSNDMSLVHKMFHVGEWGKRLRASNNDPLDYLNYAHSKEDMKMKNSVSFRDINRMSATQWHNEFLWKATKLTKREFFQRQHHHHHHHDHHHTCVHSQDSVNHQGGKAVEYLALSSQKMFCFDASNHTSYNYERECLQFADNALVNRKNILQFEILKLQI